MAEKMTRVQALEIAIACVVDSAADCEAAEVLQHMKEQLEKPRAKGEKSKTPARIANEAAARALYNTCGDEPFDSAYVMAHTMAMTPQKVVGIMNVGIKDLGLFERVQEGKKVKYRRL